VQQCICVHAGSIEKRKILRCFSLRQITDLVPFVKKTRTKSLIWLFVKLTFIPCDFLHATYAGVGNKQRTKTIEMEFWNKLFGKRQNEKHVEKTKHVKQIEQVEQIEQVKKVVSNKLNPIVENYITGLKNAYFKSNGKEEWESFEKVIHGAKRENINKLKQVYPEIPSTLINLLEYVDGTYWRKYGKDKITFYLLGSDMHEYPYYLLSSKEIVKNQNQAKEYFSEYIEREYDEVDVDDKIIDKSESLKWLHFSDCMNNGGTSQLFIDFSPSKKGIKGQVVRYLHDPDELKVIADSFDEYLNMLEKKEFDFINEETME
jgi:hypothetical protein